MGTLEQAGHRVIQKLRSVLSTDRPARELNELFRRIDAGGVVTARDARVAVRALVELKHLSDRTRAKREAIDHQIAKCPEHVQRAYRDELERGRQLSTTNNRTGE